MVDFSIAVSLIAIGGEMLGKGYEVVPLRNIAEPRLEAMDTCSAWAKTDH